MTPEQQVTFAELKARVESEEAEQSRLSTLFCDVRDRMQQDLDAAVARTMASRQAFIEFMQGLPSRAPGE